MTDGAALFSARYPVVWHVIEAEGAGPWLAETGLLPAVDLLRLAGVAADGANRDDFRLLALGGGRVAVLRQQLMADRWLTPTLTGTFADRPDAWRRHINAHVFFWTEQRRRDAFIGACRRLRAGSAIGAGNRPPLALEIDAAALLGRHAASAFVTRINSGATVRGGARTRRDDATFMPVAAYRSGVVAELAIRGPVDPAALCERRPSGRVV